MQKESTFASILQEFASELEIFYSYFRVTQREPAMRRQSTEVPVRRQKRSMMIGWAAAAAALVIDVRVWCVLLDIYKFLVWMMAYE